MLELAPRHAVAGEKETSVNKTSLFLFFFQAALTTSPQQWHRESNTPYETLVSLTPSKISH